MKLKQRNKIWIALLVAAGLLLGLGIQLSLALIEARKSRELAGRLVTQVSDRVFQLAVEDKESAAALRLCRQENLNAKLSHAQELSLELLILVNPWNPIPEGYEPQLEDVGDNQQMDSRCAQALLQMLDDCSKAGNFPYICSSYRTQQTQQMLYNNIINRLLLSGVSYGEAPAVAAMSVAIPGTSEHQLGLAVDIIDQFYTNLDEGQENTSTQQWLMENSWRYGFILRYPNGSTDITGIIYEPWHYRYVGEDFAREIFELDVTLEEYLQLRRGR